MRKFLFALTAGVAIVLFPVCTYAGFVNGDVDLRTRLEVSIDGSTWDNYSAETNPSYQTLDVNAGDTITFRIKTWNVGTADADEISLSAVTTNPQYVETANIFDGSSTTNQDLDGDALDYAVTSFDSAAGVGTFSLDGVDTGTVEAGTTNNEGGTYTTTISSSTPDQTVIQVTMTVTDASEAQRIVGKSFLFDKAHADDQATTVVRILVHNPTPSTVTATTLPATGRNTPAGNDSTGVLAISVLACIIAGSIVLKDRLNKSKGRI